MLHYVIITLSSAVIFIGSVAAQETNPRIAKAVYPRLKK